MQQLVDYIESIVKLDDEAIAELEKLVKFETYAKNEHVLEAGQYCNKIWYLKSGMVRKYYYHDGKDITTWIHTENDIFTSLQSYGQQTLTEEYLQACEPSLASGNRFCDWVHHAGSTHSPWPGSSGRHPG